MKKLILIITMLSSILLIGCSEKEYESYTTDIFAMGAYININIFSQEKVDKDIFEEVEKFIKNMDNKMSINNLEVVSEVDKINENAGIDFVKVSKDTFDLIKKGIIYTKETKSNLDITIGSLVKLWNIGFDNAKVPDDKDIKDAMKYVGINNIILNEKERSIKLDKKGSIIDLGAIAKGYVGEKVKEIILDKGYNHALLNIGGNIVCIGNKDDLNPFKVGIRDVKKDENESIGILELTDKSIVTSGIYERNLIEDGKLYHHIIDTKTGYPIENDLYGVSIISDDSTYCDALSTGIFSMGLESGLKCINSKKGVDAIFITREKEVYITNGIKDKFTLTSEEYKLVK